MAFMALLPSLIAAAGAVGGGYLASRGSSHSSSSGTGQASGMISAAVGMSSGISSISGIGAANFRGRVGVGKRNN